MTSTEQPDAGICVTIRLSARPDGGLRVSSDGLPGLMLSGADPVEVAKDIGPAILTLLEHTGQWPPASRPREAKP